MDEPQQRGMTSRKHVARLLVRGLTAADVEQVQAVVNNLRHHTFNDWHLVDQAPADLALIGQGTPVAVRGLFWEAKATLQVFEPVTHRPSQYGVLVTPLRYTALSTALTDVDRGLAARRANAADADGHDDTTLVATKLVPLRRRGDAGLRSVMEGRARVRLSRRPPADSAGGGGDDAALVRLLMAGHLSIDELVEASRQDRATCCALLRELAAAVLLDIQMSPPSFQPSSAGSPSKPTTSARSFSGNATRLAATRPSSADDDRGGLAQKLWRELGFLRS